MITKHLAVRAWTALAFTAALNLHTTVTACSDGFATRLPVLARQAVSENQQQASEAIAALRAAGPAGLQALFDVHAGLLAEKTQRHPLLATPTSNVDHSKWARVRAALDAVGRQRDCHASRLYWFTDLEQAKAAAKAQGKPILSLRLLGQLDEEFSCANSRFFRTTLYANRSVAEFLGENFILHWKSVRPAPRLTIDFGDGRKLERTITGNSIHYVLDAEGRAIDALPGLYGPRAFVGGLALAKHAVAQSAAPDSGAREDFLRQYHRDRLAAIATQWADDLNRIGKPFPTAPAGQSQIHPGTSPSAVMACSFTFTMAGVEKPILRAMTVRRDVQPAQLESAMDEETWKRIAALRSQEARLDTSSTALIVAKNPPSAAEASRRAWSKLLVEDPLIRTIKNLEQSISEDTVRNEYLLHSKLHKWFASGEVPADTDKLNAKVYAELFLTPDSDPWLGLVPRDTFTALDNNGIVQFSGKTFNTTTPTKTGL